MSWIAAVVALVAVQRLLELVVARRNTARLLAAGAVEHGGAHYPLIVALHAVWLVGLLFVVPADRVPNVWLLGLYAALQPLRLWILLSLGERWTTRVIVTPGAPLVATGPYRWLKHPNYVLVAAEIVLLPLAFGAWRWAVLFTILNAALLVVRIGVEDRALPARR